MLAIASTTRCSLVRSLPSLVLITWLTATVAACSNRSHADGPAFSIDTLPNHTVVVHNSGKGAWDSTSAWKIVEDGRITSCDSAGQQPLGFVMQVETDAAGRIYIVDGKRTAICVYDSTGKFIRTFGRKGKGPGEYQSPPSILWDAGGRLALFDGRGMRVSIVDTAGTYVRQYPSDWWNAVRRYGVRDSAGRLVVVTVPASLLTKKYWVHLYDSTYRKVDSLMIPFTDREMFATTGTGQLPIPFAASPVWRATDRYGVWFARTTEYRFHKLAWSGDTAHIVEWTGPERVPVTSADIDRYLEGNTYATKNGAVVDRSRIPKVKHAFDDFTLDDRGYLWVAPIVAIDQDKVWDIFDPTGRYLGRVHSPIALRGGSFSQPPLIRGNRLLVMARDDDGSSVVIAHIVRPD
jgi:hypothetical protein